MAGCSKLGIIGSHDETRPSCCCTDHLHLPGRWITRFQEPLVIHGNTPYTPKKIQALSDLDDWFGIPQKYPKVTFQALSDLDDWFSIPVYPKSIQKWHFRLYQIWMIDLVYRYTPKVSKSDISGFIRFGWLIWYTGIPQKYPKVTFHMVSLKGFPLKVVMPFFDHRTCEVIQSSGRKALGPGRSWKTSRDISFIDITWYIKWYIYIYISYLQILQILQIRIRFYIM